MVDITDENFEQEVGGDDQPVVVDVWAPWCGPCKMVGPALKRIHEANPARFKLAFANLEDFPVTAESLSIKATPTLIMFRDGQEVARRAGAMMQGQIEQWIEGAAGKTG